MGIRPSFKIVIGIGNAIENDPRRFDSSDEMRTHIEEDPFTKFSRDGKADNGWDMSDDFRMEMKELPWDEDTTLDGILYNVLQNGEYVCDSVVGLIREDCKYDSNVLRCFAAIDEKFMTNGFLEIQVENPAEHRLRMKLEYVSEYDILCHRFVPSVIDNVQMLRLDWQRAEFYLKQAGWNIKQEELRLLLVWDWG